MEVRLRTSMTVISKALMSSSASMTASFISSRFSIELGILSGSLIGDLHRDGVTLILDAVVAVDIDQLRFEFFEFDFRVARIGGDDQKIVRTRLACGRAVDRD